MRSILLKVFSVVIILVVGLVFMTVLGSTEKESNKREPKKEIRTVSTLDIQFENISLIIDGNGIIESQKTLNYLSEANGIVTFAKNNLKDGTFAKKGEVLVKVDDREVKNNLISLRSDLINTIASVLPDLKIENIEIYNKWYKYFHSIDVNNTVPDLPEITNSQENIKLSTRNIFTKYYAVRNQEILLSKYTIEAPFTGYIKSNGLIENSYTSRGQQLFTIIDASNVEVKVPLLVDEVAHLDFSKNPKVKVYSEKTDSYKTGYITRKETSLDRNSQSLNVFVTFTNNDLNAYFLPGNYVDVDIRGKHLNSVASIPRYLIDNDNHVYIMEDGKLNKVPVEIKAMQKDLAIISKTIPENTTLVTTVLQKPLLGMAIKSVDDLTIENPNEVDNESEPPTDGDTVAKN